jgi:YHS domain-containing protein
MEALIYFLLIAALFAVMMRFGCGAHVLGHRGKVGSGDQTRLVPPNKDKDPVCGMIVETAKAKTSVYAGRLYHFCSTSCRDKFEASPGRYIAPADNVQSSKEDTHGSSHHN